MSSGIAVKLPLLISETFGAYDLIQDYETLAKQNLKMLVLTNPGERMMDINFGVGLSQYLFEPNTSFVYSKIDQKIREQVLTYLPFLEIGKIDFTVPEDNPDLFPNSIGVQINFKIIPLNTSTTLNIEVNNNIN